MYISIFFQLKYPKIILKFQCVFNTLNFFFKNSNVYLSIMKYNMSIYLVIIKHIPIPKNIIIMYLYIISQAFFGTIETIYKQSENESRNTKSNHTQLCLIQTGDLTSIHVHTLICFITYYTVRCEYIHVQINGYNPLSSSIKQRLLAQSFT